MSESLFIAMSHQFLFFQENIMVCWILMNDDDEEFNFIQPSLIQQLKTILDQYPDDGQILKVRDVEGLRRPQYLFK